MIYARSIVSTFILVFFLAGFSESAYADSPSPSATTRDAVESPQHPEKQADTPSTTDSGLEKPEAQTDTGKEEEEPATLFYGYWKQGLYIKTPKKRFELKIGGKIYVDAGYLNSGSEIQEAFPDFDGSAYDFRKLSIAFSGSVWQKIDFKLEIDFANAQDIQDEWIRFSTIPVLKYMTFGHVKEPFSPVCPVYAVEEGSHLR